MALTLVTGGSGVVGSALARLMAGNGMQHFIVRGRNDCDLEDYTQTLRLFETHKPDFVIHLAGSVYGVGGNLKFPADIFRANTIINTNIVDAASRSGVKKFVAMGTVAMYADGLEMPIKEADVLTGTPHSSEKYYAFSKRGLLMQLEAYHRQYGMPYAMCLSTNLYGPNDRFDEDYGHVVPSLVSKFVKSDEARSPFKIWGDGSPERDFLYADDAAQGLVTVLEKGFGLFNLASGSTVKIKDLVSTLSQILPNATFDWDVSKPSGQLRRSYDISKIANIGFKPEVDLEEGLRRTVAWFKDNSHHLRGYGL